MPSSKIEAIDFDRVRRGDHQETGNGLELVWEALNEEVSLRQRQIRLAVNRQEPGVLELAPSAGLDNVDIGNSSVLMFTGASSVNVTGFIAPSGGAARLLLLSVLGSGTITLKHNVTSESVNRIFTFSTGDLAIATNKMVWLIYLNARWREIKLA